MQFGFSGSPRLLRNGAVTIGLLAAATGLSFLVGGNFEFIQGGSENTQLVFLLAVLLISRYTDGYFWGLLSAAVSVPLVNYMFTYPYFVFNLTISGYFLTFVTMLTVSLIVSILTSRIHQQEQLRLEAEKEKLRSNLLRAVSHDLRTPLTSIVGATGAILDNTLPHEKQQELLEDVLGEAVIKFHKHFADVEVQLDVPEDIVLAEMNAVLIEQVVLNLMENAVYHGKTTTRIILSIAHDGAWVKITVSDNGAGIARDRLATLFTSQTESPRRTADSNKHMGIGLSVCQSIVKAHGGTMSVCSNETGGASFTFTLSEKENDYGSEDSDC